MWEPFQPGVFHGLDAKVYRDAPGCNQSAIKHAGPTDAHMVASVTAKSHESTAAQVIGTLVHHAILEPDKELPLIAVRPDGFDGRSSEGKAWMKRQRDEGRTILDRDEWDMIQGCIASIRSNEAARLMFVDGQSEVSLFGDLFDTNGRPAFCKARLDFLPYGNFLPDIKTTSDASEKEFSSSILEWGYHVQAAWYIDIYNHLCPNDKREAFAFVAVEKRPPFASRVYSLCQRAIEHGRREYKRLLTRYIDCMTGGRCQSYPQEIVPIDLPERAYIT